MLLLGAVFTGLCMAQNSFGLPAREESPAETGNPEPPDLSLAVPITSPVFEEIERTVERMRGLKFESPVQYLALDRSNLKAIVQKELFKVYSREELLQEGLAYEKMGFVPEGVGEKLVDTYLSLLEEQIGAFYEPITNQLVTLGAKSYDNPVDRMLLAHELTHALEDQHFGLEELPLDEKGNDDKILAISSVLEGSATRLMDQFFIQDSVSGNIELDDLAVTGGFEQIANAPMYMRETLTFPYFGGRKFVDDLVSFGGMPLLNQTLENLPTTTEQILHPEKYYPQPEPPMDCPEDLPPFLEGGGAEILAENSAGELGVRLFLTQHLNAFQSIGPAMGWNGDRWFFYRYPGKDNERLYGWDWWLAWDTPADAKEFLSAYRKAVKSWKGDDFSVENADSEPDEWFLAHGKAWQLQIQMLDEKQVLLRLRTVE